MTTPDLAPSTPSTPSIQPASPSGAPPLFVDLDGTLLRGDSLWESLAQLLRKQPATLLLRAPFWLLRGRAGFKAA
ncbi:MAG: hypothetical protein JRH17_24625, partial [Deltaproteobacteria bacterium]|nr:hypothetical protein [Deltaproteobacteria bacterium]